MDIGFSLSQTLQILSVVSAALSRERRRQQGSDNGSESDGSDNDRESEGGHQDDDRQLSTEAAAVAMAVAIMRSLVLMTRTANSRCSSSSSGGEEPSSSAASAAVMAAGTTLQQLMNLPRKQRHGLVRDLQDILDGVIHTRRHDVYEFYSVWREWIWLLILSGPDRGEGGGVATAFSVSCYPSLGHHHCLQPSLTLTPCQVFGWEMVEWVINSSARHRPPPRAYHVKGAGHRFVNGMYMYAGPLTPEGYALVEVPDGGYDFYGHGNSSSNNDNDDDYVADYSGVSEIMYRRTADLDVPTEVNGEAESIGDDHEASKTLTIFQCLLGPNWDRQMYWFLSEQDEERPGTDMDVDYYSNFNNCRRGRRSRLRRNNDVHPLASKLPPTDGWEITTDDVGHAPPPSHAVEIGAMVPHGQESSTLEYQLAQWMLQNDLLPMAMRLARHHPVIANHFLPLVMQFGAVTMFELDLAMTGWEAEERSLSHCQVNQKGSATANIGTQFILELAHWSLSREEGDNSISHGRATITGGEPLQM